MSDIIRGHADGTVSHYRGPIPEALAGQARIARASTQRVVDALEVTLPPAIADFHRRIAHDAAIAAGSVVTMASQAVGRNLEVLLPHMIGEEAARLVYFVAIRASLPAGDFRDLSREEWAIVAQDLAAAGDAIHQVLALLQTGGMTEVVTGPWLAIDNNLRALRNALGPIISGQHPEWGEGPQILWGALPLLPRSVDMGQVSRMRGMTPNDPGNPHHPVGCHMQPLAHNDPRTWQV